MLRSLLPSLHPPSFPLLPSLHPPSSLPLASATHTSQLRVDFLAIESTWRSSNRLPSFTQYSILQTHRCYQKQNKTKQHKKTLSSNFHCPPCLSYSMNLSGLQGKAPCTHNIESSYDIILKHSAVLLSFKDGQFV